MGFTCKENEEDARERLRAFWKGSSLGRPALHVTVDQSSDTTQSSPFDHLSLKDRDLLPEWHAWSADRSLESTLYLAEAMPNATIRWGSHLVAVASLIGADYHYKSNSAWVEEIPDLWEWPLPEFDPDSHLVKRVEECLHAVAATVGHRGYVNPTVMLDGLTHLSQFRTPERLCMEVLERPEDVRQWSDALTSVYLDCYDHFYRLVSDLGYGDTSSWLSAMAEGSFEAVQCDFAVMISPEMFKQFVMPDLERLTSYFDYSLYHLDGTCQLRFLDQLASLPHLDGIQWNPEPGAGSPLKWLDAFRDIRRRGLSLHVSCSPEEGRELTSALGPDGLILVFPRFKSVEVAEQAIQEIQAAADSFQTRQPIHWDHDAEDESHSLDPLIDVHEALDALLLQHQEALLDHDIGRARELFQKFQASIEQHIEIEDHVLLPVYTSNCGQPEGGATRFFDAEHRKVEKYVAQISDELSAISAESDLPKARIIHLIETEAQLKNLLEHHDRREQRFLYPLLATHTTSDEREKMWMEIEKL